MDDRLRRMERYMGLGSLAAGLHHEIRNPLAALSLHLRPPSTVVIRGEPAAMAPWRALVDAAYVPGRQVFAIDAQLTGLPPSLSARAAPATGVAAYLCEGDRCGPPVSDLDEFEIALASG